MLSYPFALVYISCIAQW